MSPVPRRRIPCTGRALLILLALALLGTGDVRAQGFEDSPSTGERSENLEAIAYSALLPGLAQWKLGHKNRAVGFWIAEAAFWSGFAAYRVQGHIREDSYIEMASLYGGVESGIDRDDDYYKLIGSWPSSDLYDELVVRRNARAVEGDDLDARDAYFEANRTPGQDRWSWDSSAARARFSDKRTESQTSFKRSRNMIGLAVVNRIVAMIDAVMLSNRQSSSAYRLQMQPRVYGENWEGRLSLTRRWP